MFGDLWRTVCGFAIDLLLSMLHTAFVVPLRFSLWHCLLSMPMLLPATCVVLSMLRCLKGFDMPGGHLLVTEHTHVQHLNIEGTSRSCVFPSTRHQAFPPACAEHTSKIELAHPLEERGDEIRRGTGNTRVETGIVGCLTLEFFNAAVYGRSGW